jgi:hypothetical protein
MFPGIIRKHFGAGKGLDFFIKLSRLISRNPLSYCLKNKASIFQLPLSNFLDNYVVLNNPITDSL